MPDGHSGTVRQLSQQYHCLSTHGRGVPCRLDTDHAHCLGRRLGLQWQRPGHRGRPHAGRVAVSAVIAVQTTTCPLVVRVRLSPGHLSGASDRRHRHQLGKECRTAAVRTEVPEAADGQSADCSGSLQLPLLFSRPACGRPPAAAVLGRQRNDGNRGAGLTLPPSEPQQSQDAVFLLRLMAGYTLSAVIETYDKAILSCPLSPHRRRVPNTVVSRPASYGHARRREGVASGAGLAGAIPARACFSASQPTGKDGSACAKSPCSPSPSSSCSRSA
jgi:hypothetical protein